MATDLGTLMIKLGVDTSGVLTAKVAVEQMATTAATTAAKAKASFSLMSKETLRSFNNVAQKFRTLGYLASITLTTPIVAFTKQTTQMAKDFEFTLSKIQGTLQVTASQTQQWGEGVLRMAPKVATAPQKIADALYFAASAGFKGKEAMEITEVAAKAAAVGLGETRHVVDMLVSAMNAYRQSNLSAERAMDIFTAAVRRGKIEAGQFVTSIGAVLPIAAELGVSLDQVTGAMAAMSLSGASATNAATYLRNMLQRLADPSSHVEELLNKMGTSAEGLRASLRERGLLATLEEMRRLTEEYGETMYDIFPNIRALIGALNLTGENLEFNRKIFQDTKDAAGDFSNAFEVAAETVQFKWNAAIALGQSSMIELGQTILQVLLPVMEGLMKRVRSFTTWFNNLSEASKRLMFTFTAIVASIGPLSLAISVLAYIVGSAITAVDKLIASLRTLALFIRTHPYVAFAAAIAAVTVAIVRHVRKVEEWEGIQRRLNELIGVEALKLDQAFKRLRDTAEGTEARATAIRNINSQYGDYLKNLLTEKSTLEDIANAQTEATNALVAHIAVQNLQEERGKLLNKLAKAQRQHLGDFVSSYREFIKVAGESPTDATRMVNDFTMSLNTLMDELQRMAKTESIIREMKYKGVVLPEFHISEQGEQLFVGALKEFEGMQALRKYALVAHVDILPLIKDFDTLEEAFKSLKEKGDSAGIALLASTVGELRDQVADTPYRLTKLREFYDAWISDIVTSTGKVKFSFNDFVKAVDKYLDKKSGIDPTLGTINDLIAAYTSAGIQIQEVGDEADIMYTKFDNPILKKLIKEMNEAETEILRMDKAFKRLGIASEARKQLYQLYSETLESIGKKVDFSVAEGAIRDIYKRLLGLGNAFADAGIDLKKLMELTDEYERKAAMIKYMAQHAHELGIEFNYGKEMSELLVKSLKKLIEHRGAGTEFAQRLRKELRNLHPEIYEANILLDNLYDELDQLQLRSKYAFADFSLPAANQKAIGDTIDKLIELRVNTELIGEAFVPLASIVGTTFLTWIPLVDMLDAKIRELVKEYKRMGDAAALEDLKRTLDISKQQVEAYSSLANQLDVITKEIYYTERRIHNLSSNMEGNKEIIDALAKSLDILRIRYLNVQAAADVKYYEMLSNAFGKYGDQMELVGAQIHYVEQRLRLLAEASVKDAAWATDVERWLDVLYRLRQQADSLNAVTDSINNLASAFGSLGSMLGEVEGQFFTVMSLILRALPQILDLITKYGTTSSILKPIIDAETIAIENNTLAKQAEALASQQSAVAKATDSAASISNAADSGSSAAASYANAGAKAVEANASAVASGAKVPFPGNIVAITLGVAAVIAGLLAALPKPKRMKTGGIVPPGYPDDTYPALLTSGEIVLPPSKAMEFAENLIRTHERERKFAKEIPQMRDGGIVPPGYPNDTYHAMLSSGEVVLPHKLREGLQSIEQRPVHVVVDVNGKISGRDLMLVLRRANYAN